MCKKVYLEVAVNYPDGMTSLGTVHELDYPQVLEVALGVVHALDEYMEGFDFHYTSKEEDTYNLILRISEDTGKEREEMDEIVESTMVLVTVLSLAPVS